MRRLAMTLAACALTLSACSSASTPAAKTTASIGPDTITISNFMFMPMNLTVAPGTKVTVTNQDATAHTLTSTANPHAFTTDDIAPGKSTTFTAPTAKGTYTYICSIHQYMQGTITVS